MGREVVVLCGNQRTSPSCCHSVNSYWKSAAVKVPRHPPPGTPNYLLPGCVHAAGVRWSWSRDSVRRRSHGFSANRATSLTLHNPYSSSNPLRAPARAPEVCPLHPKTGKNHDHALGTELWHLISADFFAPIEKTQRAQGPQTRPTRSQKADSKRMTARVRRKRHLLRPNAPIKSGPQSLLSPSRTISAGPLPIGS
jgi:hypothetical protein